jgi:predicted flap endonuclease-1-like 5' DNA nuclease
MTLVLAVYLPWISMALLLGVTIGWMAGPVVSTAPRERWFVLAFAAAAAVWVAVMAFIPGRPGHAFEVILCLAAAYLAGCFAGDRIAAAIVAPAYERTRAHRPPAIARPGDGGDDLTLIGVAPNEARALGDVGVWRLAQIAGWTREQMEWIAVRVGAPAQRVQRDWVEGARARLARSSLAAATVLAQGAPESTPIELLRIAGIGPRLAAALAELGVRRIDQIAAWRQQDIEWLEERLGETGRISRELWVVQARLLYAGVETSASTDRLLGRLPATNPDAPLDAAKVSALRVELEELSAAGGVAAFSGYDR